MYIADIFISSFKFCCYCLTKYMYNKCTCACKSYSVYRTGSLEMFFFLGDHWQPYTTDLTFILVTYIIVLYFVWQ